MEAAHCIRASSHRQQTSCMCDISCGICLSHWGWVSMYCVCVCVCLYIGITSMLYISINSIVECM